MNKRISGTLTLILATLPVAALAHTGQGDHGFLDGLAHPFLGLDHLLAMLVVGVWSVLNTRKVWLAPVCFIVMLSCGTLLGQHGLIFPLLEPLVAISVLVLGILLTQAFRPGIATALVLIGGFAVSHGMAHGGELSAGTSVLVGIILGSLLLHVTGMSIAHLFLKGRPQLTCRFGQVIAVLGGGLIVSSVLG